MQTLEYVTKKFNLDPNIYSGRMPIEIPNYGRKQLADLFRELDFKVGVEVGVAAGEYSEILCEANPQAMIYAIDPWGYYREYRDYTRKETFNRLYEDAYKRLAHRANCQMVQKTSMEALKDFKDDSVDFVYIDANHRFEFVANDIAGWSRKLKHGGIISGHDYIRAKSKDGMGNYTHVFECVNAYTDAYRIKPWFILGTNAILPGEIRDRCRSWMWVKP